MTGYFKPFDRARCGWDRDDYCDRSYSRHHERDLSRYRSRSRRRRDYYY